jgi:hypothetical protein
MIIKTLKKEESPWEDHLGQEYFEYFHHISVY